jgi:hypothetical protein
MAKDLNRLKYNRVILLLITVLAFAHASIAQASDTSYLETTIQQDMVTFHSGYLLRIGIADAENISPDYFLDDKQRYMVAAKYQVNGQADVLLGLKPSNHLFPDDQLETHQSSVNASVSIVYKF